jgi:hypothetical protein
MTHKILSMYLFLFLTLHMFQAHRAHHQERQIVSIQPLVTVTLCRWVCRVQVGAWPPTQSDSYQRLYWHNLSLPDDEHDVLEICGELKIKINTYKGICASRWSFTKNRLCTVIVWGNQYLYDIHAKLITVPPSYMYWVFSFIDVEFTRCFPTILKHIFTAAYCCIVFIIQFNSTGC